MKEIAKLANVSQATVSRVLNGSLEVNQTVAKRVLEASKYLEYDVKKITSRNGFSKNQIIGLLLPDITNPVFPLMIKGAESGASKYGYNLLLGDSGNNPRTEFSRLQDLLSQRVKGLIWIVSEDPSKAIASTEGLDIPIVFLDRSPGNQNVNFVGSMDEDGALQASRYLLSLGHRNILYISGPKNIKTAVARLSGFMNACHEIGHEPNPKQIINGDFSIESGYTITKQALKKREDLTCIFAANDLMAFGALKALRSEGVQVPEEISVIGYDDIPYSELIGLTTVSQPSFEIGYNAFTLLHDILEHRITPPQTMMLRPILTIRTSCKKI